MKGILIVEAEPSSADREAEFHEWYEKVHIPEVLGLDGVLAARRFAPVDGQGPHTAVYELEADDLSAIITDLFTAVGDGRIQMSDAMQMQPPPVMRLLELRVEQEAS